MREVIVYNYRIIYQTTELGVDILTVIHGARRLRRPVIKKGRERSRADLGSRGAHYARLRTQALRSKIPP